MKHKVSKVSEFHSSGVNIEIHGTFGTCELINSQTI